MIKHTGRSNYVKVYYRATGMKYLKYLPGFFLISYTYYRPSALFERGRFVLVDDRSRNDGYGWRTADEDEIRRRSKK